MMTLTGQDKLLGLVSVLRAGIVGEGEGGAMG